MLDNTLIGLIDGFNKLDNSIDLIKEEFKNNLLLKEVEVSSDENISNMSDLILQIKGSKFPSWYVDKLKGTLIRCVSLTSSESIFSIITTNHVNLTINKRRIYFYYLSSSYGNKLCYYDVDKNEFYVTENYEGTPNTNAKNASSYVYFKDCVYVSRLSDSNGNYLTEDNHYMYNITEKTWEKKADIPSTFLLYGKYVAYKNYIYIIRTSNGSYMQTYDIETDTFTAKKGCIFSNAKQFGVLGNIIYGTNYYDFAVYNVVTDTWTRKAYFPNTNVTKSNLVEVDGKLHSAFNMVLSNYVDTPTVFRYVYDDLTDTWSTLNDSIAIGAGVQVEDTSCSYYLNRVVTENSNTTNGNSFCYIK